MNATRWKHPGLRSRGRRGLTLVELMVAVFIGTGVSLGLASMLIVASRMEKSILTQELAVSQLMKSVETFNREIRSAQTPLQVVDAGGTPAVQGNRVLFNRAGEASGRRSIALVSDDGDMMTCGDNRLIYDPNTGQSGDEIVLARRITPLEAAGALRYEGATAPLQVRLRLGDPVAGASQASNVYTGAGLQGLEINIFVAPRNDSID